MSRPTLAVQIGPGLSPGVTGDFFVSPLGSDLNPGTIAMPFATLAKAQQAARVRVAAGQRANVCLRAGIHYLSATLVFDSRDNGCQYVAFPGESPVVSGATPISNWTVSGGVWSAPYPNTLTHTRHASANNLRATRATRGGLSNQTENDSGYTLPTGQGDTSLAGTLNPRDVEFVLRMQWSECRAPMASISTDGTLITMAQPGWSYVREIDFIILRPAPIYQIENDSVTFNANKTPGSFYLDWNGQALNYVPRSGESPNVTTIVAAQMERIIVGYAVTNLAFYGIAFVDTTWLLPGSVNAYPHVQAGSYQPAVTNQPNGLISVAPLAAVTFLASTGVRVARCVFTRIGGGAIHLWSGCSGCVVRGNIVKDIDGNGITEGDPASFKFYDGTRNNLIADNVVHNCGVNYRGCCGIARWYTDNSTIRNNIVHDLPYTGISIGWGWDTSTSLINIRNNDTSSNIVHDTMQVMNDGGGIYSNGAQAGATIANNLIFNTAFSNGTASGASLYLDNGSANVTASAVFAYTKGTNAHFYHLLANQCLGPNTVGLIEDIDSEQTTGGGAAPSLSPPPMIMPANAVAAAAQHEANPPGLERAYNDLSNA